MAYTDNCPMVVRELGCPFYDKPRAKDQMTKRTLTLLFDDDVVKAFVKEGNAFTIDEVIKDWQEGRVTADLARRAISQTIAARTLIPEQGVGLTTNDLMQTLEHLVRTYPKLYSTP